MINDNQRDYHHDLHDKSKFIGSEYLCGMGAGLLSVIVTFPVNKLMFRQSVWGFDVVSAIRQLRIEGIGYLYRGIGPPLFVKPLTSSLMFGTYNQFYRMLWMKNDGYNLQASLIASLLSGATEALVSTPFERVQMILQDGRFNNQYTNMFDTFYQIRRYGIQEYYRGFRITVLRNGPSTFLYFCSLDYCEQRLSNELSSLSTTKHHQFVRKFITGALLGATISTLIYPLNVIRTRIQIQPIGTKHMTIRTAFEQLLMERIGTERSLVAGIHANLVRSFLHWGCLTAISDLIRNKIN
ncbi:mitochondrial nicotinamide adenine dinucleotide transporter SLC25A51 [Dermatophagoides farinae]|nr:mitochondrial nicotinamide adenine dinucleotide transporter SLC25A51-like [Dermatophagoides farinae]KAH7643432.1 hypothetical protein HUG17_10123 [Dermatophagoides farinae]